MFRIRPISKRQNESEKYYQSYDEVVLNNDIYSNEYLFSNGTCRTNTNTEESSVTNIDLKWNKVINLQELCRSVNDIRKITVNIVP